MTDPIDVAMLERIALRTRREDECIVWLGAQVRGYGRIYIDGNGKPRPVHRVAYEAMYGPVPPHLVMDHLCRNPSCVRLDHLEPVTNRENILRGKRGEWGRRSHCKRGHPWDDENTRWQRHSDGHMQRACRACERIKDAARRDARRRARGVT